MSDLTSEKSAQSDLSSPVPEFAARVATYSLALASHTSDGPDPHSSEYLQEVFKGVIDALTADARVREINAPSGIDCQAITFSSAAESSDGRPPSPHRHIHSMSFSHPLVLKVEVPRRLQPQYNGADAPAELYWAAWDGLTLVVLWDSSASAKPFSSSGGLVIMDIIGAAAETAGAKALKRPCGHNCGYPFAHQDLLVRAHSATQDVRIDLMADDDPYTGRREHGPAVLQMPGASDPGELALAIVLEMSFLGLMFTTLRSVSAAVARTQAATTHSLTNLLNIHYEQAAIAALPLGRSLKRRWASRGMSQEKRRLTAGLWIRLASLEALGFEWRDAEFVYEGVMSTRNLGLVFESEYSQEAHLLSILRTDSARAVIEQISSSFDNRLVALATAGGAVVGALVGAGVGQL